MVDITGKEKAFLDKLREILRAQNPQQQAMYDAMYTAAEAQLAEDGLSPAAKVFEAMQRGLDVYVNGKIDQVVAQNKKDADAAIAKVKETKDTTPQAIAGRVELETLKANLQSAITTDKTKEIVEAVTTHMLPVQPGEPLGFHANYSAPSLTEKVSGESAAEVDKTGKVLFTTTARDDKGKTTIPYPKKYEGIVRDKANTAKWTVREDLDKGNDVVEYDTVSNVAEALVRRFNMDTPQKLSALVVNQKGYTEYKEIELPAARGHFMKNVNTVTDWLKRANVLVTVDGKACDLSVKNPQIRVGQELVVPWGNDIAPKQAYFICKKCMVEPKVEPGQFSVEVDAQTNAPTVKPWTPHEFVRHATESTDKYYRAGSYEHALMTLARSGLDEQFTKEYYALKNIVARKAVRSERNAGQIGKGNFAAMEGDYIGKNKQSKLDELTPADVEELRAQRADIEQSVKDGNIKPEEAKNYLADIDDAINEGEGYKRGNRSIGGRGYLGRVATGVRTGVRFNGYADVVTEGDDKGAYERDGHFRFAWAHGGNYAYAVHAFGVNKAIPLGKLGGLPVGASLSRPDHQEKFFSVQERWGLSQAHVALAEVNFGGYDNLFMDQRARLDNPQEAPDRINAYTYALNSKKHFVDAMQNFDKATDPAVKQAEAENALHAFRDLRSNMLMMRADAKDLPHQKNEEAIRRYFESQKIDLAKIDANLKGAEPFDVVDMPLEQLKQQQDYWILKKTRYRDIKPGETNDAYKAVKPYAYRTMNHFEAEIAKGNATEPASMMDQERLVINQSRDAWNRIIANPAAKGAFVEFLDNDRNVQIEMGNILHDIYRNPSHYGFKNRDEAKTMLLDRLIGDEKDVRKQVTRQGHSSPLVILGDQPYHNSNPGLLGRAVAENLRNVGNEPEKRYLLNDLINTLTQEKNPLTGRAMGVDSEGRTDGRRGANALLRSYGAELSAKQEGEFGEHYAKLDRTLTTGDKEVVRKAVLDATAFAERGASGRRVNAVQYLDNTFVEEQHRVQAGDAVDYNQTYDRLFTSDKAKETGADRIIIHSLRDRPGLARDAVLATALRHPEVLDELEDKLQAMKGTSIRSKYGSLKRTFNAVERAMDHYQKTGDDADLQKAVEKFGKYFTKMEVNNENNRGSLRNNAWNVLLNQIANDTSLSGAVIETVSNDALMRDAFLKSVPDAIMTADGVKVTNRGNRGGDGRQFADTRGDDLYQSRFFTHKENSEGEVKRGTVEVNLDAVKYVVHVKDDAQVASVNVNGVPTNENTISTEQDVKNPANTKVHNGALSGKYAQLLKDHGFNATGITVGNVLGTNDVLYTGTIDLGTDAKTAKLTKAEKQQLIHTKSVESLGGFLQVSGLTNKLLTDLNTLEIPADQKLAIQNMTPQQLQTYLATFLIDNKLVEVKQNANQLTFVNATNNIDAAIAAGGNLNAVQGLVTWYALFAIPCKTPVTPPAGVPCPTCPPGTTWNPPGVGGGRQ